MSVNMATADPLQQWVNKSNEQKQTYAEWKGKQA